MNRPSRNEEDLARFHCHDRPTLHAKSESALQHIAEDVARVGVFRFMRARSKFHLGHDAFMARKTTEVLPREDVAFGTSLLRALNGTAGNGQENGEHHCEHNCNQFRAIHDLLLAVSNFSTKCADSTLRAGPKTAPRLAFQFGTA